jgi:hypothetical protein
MKSITRLFSAVATLACSLEGLAALVDVTSGRLRQSLALEAPAEVESTVLEQLPAPGDNPPADASPRRKAKVVG